MADTPITQAPELTGEAGYISPYPYLDKLQEKMEERLARKVPAAGRFCGFCYARLRETDAACPFCSADVSARGTLQEVPQDVLRLYKMKRDTEARWVYGLGFVGLIVASILFVVLEVWGPGPLGHPAVGFAVLLFGGYGLAQLFGTLIGGQIGYRRGARKRDAMWSEWVAKRDEEA
jgi:hypothetical protein